MSERTRSSAGSGGDADTPRPGEQANTKDNGGGEADRWRARCRDLERKLATLNATVHLYAGEMMVLWHERDKAEGR